MHKLIAMINQITSLPTSINKGLVLYKETTEHLILTTGVLMYNKIEEVEGQVCFLEV